MRLHRSIAAPLLGMLLAGASAPAVAGPISLDNFKSQTGINVGEKDVTSIWNALVTMGTTKFLGGNLGSLKLDESSMIAGAATLGASEFDNFLRSGSLGTSVSGLSGLLTQRMTSGAGMDLSYLVGSFTGGGGIGNGAAATFSNLASGGGATEGEAMCDSAIGNQLASVGEQRVNGLVNAALGSDMGFSPLKGLTAGAGGKGSGFSSLGCLDKLFQGSGADILFKPPSLGNLTNMLSNWSCGEAMSVAQQVMGNFNTDVLKTGQLGGFFPASSMTEAMGVSATSIPGISKPASEVFGEAFAKFNSGKDSDIKQAASLRSVFK